MIVARRSRRTLPFLLVFVCLAMAAAILQGQQPDTRDSKQPQDEAFAKAYKEWTGEAKYGSPLVDHLPLVKGIPTPKDVLGYYIGAPRKLTYYADILKFYRALAAATPRVKVETIGRSDEGRELAVVWVSSEQNIKLLAQNRANLAKLADPRGLTDPQIQQVMAATKPNYHLIGGLHSSESGPSEMLMELVYRIATETSPFITQIRNNVYVSVTPAADPDGRDRYVDSFYQGLEQAQAAGPGEGRGGGGAVPYWGKYVFHDNNRDINLALNVSRAIVDWYYTAHPPIMHDLHESMTLMYTFSGGPPQNPNLDPLLFAELPWFSSWELAQMTKWGMPGVYQWAFMDGWSPGYYGSVAYNHNALMKMYETQSGRDSQPPTPPTTAPSPGAAPAGNQAPPAAGRGAVVANAAPPATPPPTTPPPATPPQGGRGAGQGRGTPPVQGAPVTAAPAGTPPQGGTPPAGTPATPQQGRGTVPAEAGRGAMPADAGRGGGAATGRGGAQDREWYRGLPVPAGAAAVFSRRDNTNYMETGILSSLQLAAMFPSVVVENFYVKTRNAIEDGRTKPPYGFVIPPQRDMTKAAELVRILRLQGIEVGQAASAFKVGDATFGAGSYVIKRDQPYGRLAKNLLEKQLYPDARLTTYDDSGWTMGLLMMVDVKEIADPAILKVAITPVGKVTLKGRIAGTGTAGLAVAHYGSNNMITFRYRLRNVPMKIAEKSFTAEGVEFPAGSFVVAGAISADARAAVEDLGLTAAALTAMPQVAAHGAVAPRIAIYSQWTSTQDLGWYRLAFDNLGVPYDLIFKEQVKKGDLRAKYDVILMAAQNLNRAAVFQAAAARPQPYQKSEKYKSLGMYGETPDMSGGFGQEGVDAFAKFLEGGGTLIAAGASGRFPIELGWAHTVDAEPIPGGATGVTAYRPIVQGEIVRPEHPAFYGYTDKIVPMKYNGGFTLRVGVADQANVLARYVGGDASVLSGGMVGADLLRQKVFAVDVPNALNGKGRVVLFASNPIYRWQNHGEFNMVFNSLLNWNYIPPAPAATPPPAGAGRGRGGF